MSVGLMALLDDIAALAKVAAASIDDIAGQAAKAGVKAAGVVIDDAAVTPRYVTDFSPARRLSAEKTMALLPGVLAKGLRNGVEFSDGQFDDAHADLGHILRGDDMLIRRIGQLQRHVELAGRFAP